MNKFKRLPAFLSTLRHLMGSLHEIRNELVFTKTDIREKEAQIAKLNQTLDGYELRLRNQDERLAELSVVAFATPAPAAPTDGGGHAPLLADNHQLDAFYLRFEERFRGSEEEISEKLQVYVPYLQQLPDEIKDKEIVDIGCGRGEMLKLINGLGMKSRGLDLNHAMVERANAQGLTAEFGEAVAYLSALPSGSLAGVTGFHLVEHIPFDILLSLFRECYRVLAPGGIIIFETPNPENLTVGACNFYYDPSHLHPLPPEMLKFTLQTRGFQDAEILRLQPMRPSLEDENELVAAMAQKLFGPADYSIVAHKP